MQQVNTLQTGACPCWKALRDFLRRSSMQRRIRRWKRAGSPVPPPHAVKQGLLRQYAAQYGLRTLVETGTCHGDMVAAMVDVFAHIYSIELSPEFFTYATRRFRHAPHVELINGDSGRELGRLMPRLVEPALFWLDGHYSGGATAKGEKETPVCEELEAILSAPECGHVILIDDARCFGTMPSYPSLDALREFVRLRRPNAAFIAQDDSIRITPTP